MHIYIQPYYSCLLLLIGLVSLVFGCFNGCSTVTQLVQILDDTVVHFDTQCAKYLGQRLFISNVLSG